MKAIDLFAGWGGFTLGASMAGVEVVWAANHWPLAVETHAANHPTVEHVCQDLRQADWTKLPRFDLLLASPACQGHSQASQPRRRLYHDNLRATAWAVVDCADVTEPRAILVENVLDLKRWRLYPQWVAALEAMGYHVQERVESATDHGVPQRRTRLFVVATKRRVSMSATPKRVEPAFGPEIEQDADGWRSVTEASPGARVRIDAAQKRIGPRCLVQHVTGHKGVPLSEPIRTITTKDQWIIVDGSEYRPLTMREHARGMGFPDSYTWADGLPRATVVRGLGNAVPPLVAKAMVAEVAEAA